MSHYGCWHRKNSWFPWALASLRGCSVIAVGGFDLQLKNNMSVLVKFCLQSTCGTNKCWPQLQKVSSERFAIKVFPFFSLLPCAEFGSIMSSFSG